MSKGEDNASHGHRRPASRRRPCKTDGGLFSGAAGLAPGEWGPMSINLEDVPYPHPVSYYSFTLEGRDVRMAYMDVAPLAAANGRSVVLLHGMNFFGEAWTDTIEILRKEGYRVIVPGPDRVRALVEADPALFDQHARLEHQAAPRASRNQDDGCRHPLHGRDGREPLCLVLSRSGRQPGDDQSNRVDRRAQPTAVARDIGGVQGGARPRLRRDREGHARLLREVEARVP